MSMYNQTQNVSRAVLPLTCCFRLVIMDTACCKIDNLVCGLSFWRCKEVMRPNSLKASLISRTRILWGEKDETTVEWYVQQSGRRVGDRMEGRKGQLANHSAISSGSENIPNIWFKTKHYSNREDNMPSHHKLPPVHQGHMSHTKVVHQGHTCMTCSTPRQVLPSTLITDSIVCV